MYISKKDALDWFRFFTELTAEGEQLTNLQSEIALSVLSQIEQAVEAQQKELQSQIPGLKTLMGRTYYIGDDAHFPKGCKSCLTGTGLSAIRKTNKCDAACPFCYNYGELDCIPPIGDDMWEIGGTKYREEDLDLILSIQNKPSGVAYVYLEPFMEIEKYYSFIKRIHDHGIYQHLYTNGIHADEEKLKALGEAGLDEIRFNLGASNCSDKIIEKITVAKKYIPMVGVETPMTREFYAQLQKKKDKLLATGLDFMNLAELHLNENNIGNYWGDNMYIYRQGYLSPIMSRVLTLKTMKQAAEERWPVVIHDCDNRTKFARDINLKAVEGGWFGASSYGSEWESIPFEAFLPVLEDPDFKFIREEPLPEGYRVGDIVI